MSAPKDRAAILRRRAFFVGSALTALTGCPKQESPQQEKPPVVGVDPASSASTPSPHPVSPPPVPPEPAGKMPSLAIPPDAKGVVRQEYERIANDVPRIHAELDGASQALGTICDITDPKCDAAWMKVAKHLAQAENLIFDLAPLCPATSVPGKAFEARLHEHQNHIDDRKKGLSQRIDALLNSDKAKLAWKTHKAKAAVPRPCLDYGCGEW